MFLDTVKIRVEAGNGGDGAVSFHREKYVAAGGPDGGDGGKGGDIIFVVDDNLSTLIDFHYKKKYRAQHGENGRGNRCSGKSGQDLIIRVPRGTLVIEEHSGQKMVDLSDDQPVVIAKGGKGGWGNSHFATPTRQIPRFAKPGRQGETFDLVLELKLLADVGLVGFPNVGKSTLLSVVSAAKPKIANYHFTTLTPVLGVVRMGENHSFVMADIPGLVEGASDGVGLGHDFLRHVQRCRLLLHLVDVSGSEGRNPLQDFLLINKELERYHPDLLTRPMIAVANKCDMATQEQKQTFQREMEKRDIPVLEISAVTTHGVDTLLQTVFKMLKDLPPIEKFEPDYQPQIETGNGQKFTILCEDGVYYIQAPWLERILSTANMDDYESLQYFQRVLRSSGVIDELERCGIDEGDTVDIGGFRFDFVL